MELRDRIKWIRKGQSRKEFADKLGINASTVQRYETEGVVPGGEVLKAMHEIFHVDIHWLLTGAGTPYIEKALSPEDYYFIGKAEGAASGGPGKVVFDNIVEYFPFKQSFMQRVGGSTEEKRKNIFLLQVKGNSMHPAIANGELVMVNCNDEQRMVIVNDGIYAVRTQDGDVVIKRLYMVAEDKESKLLVVSDNRVFKTYEIDLTHRDLRDFLVGRVVWVGKELI